MDADLSLPGLDSNQEPIGTKPSLIAFPRDRKPRTTTPAPASARPIVKLSTRRNAS